ncbi:cytochrome P450 [Rhodocollybia butyracea]|uniref:Cytochrome P450 n=1 Tax=Rhodocollybia butyracea TaxID=206335 RepID=A0A9P5U258_9AGAR|nr:cytochrome P450 [Rhodocollybia butyracea]
MSMAPGSSFLAFGIAVSAVALIYLFPRRRQSVVESYPPGPKSPNIPTLDAWVQYQDWGREYGSLLFFPMTQHPDVQTKAQAEIDHVIGRDRLPTFEDRQSLPYVESIYREIMRMHPPALLV